MEKIMIDPIVLFDKLAGFETAYEIAKYLESEDIKGERACPDNCVISVFMSENSGRLINANKSQIHINQDDPEFNSRTATIGYCTPAMSEFIQNFDNGMYPYLVRGSW